MFAVLFLQVLDVLKVLQVVFMMASVAGVNHHLASGVDPILVLGNDFELTVLGQRLQLLL
jgi:hypothetical protein